MVCHRTVLILAICWLGGFLGRTPWAAEDVAPESDLGGEEAIRPYPESEGPRWWKGNLHTHSLWSDGQEFPKVIVDWYKRHGYHFLALSDHNVLSAGRLRIAVPGLDPAIHKLDEQRKTPYRSYGKIPGQGRVRPGGKTSPRTGPKSGLNEGVKPLTG